jgi:hypothetical protein
MFFLRRFVKETIERFAEFKELRYIAWGELMRRCPDIYERYNQALAFE